ncbi:MAG TPA: pyrroloquinoline quinone-dependent dehydrogenase [Vicinamibacterales bacterium]|jgi:quinoprotein glucose dehydrogenase
MLTSSRARVVAVIVAVGVGVSLAAQRRTAPRPTMPAGEWWYYGGDSAGTKYSPLDQIDRDTVKTLRVAWRWKTDNFGASPEYNLEATPLMVKGVLYTTAGTRRAVVAIDAATGETLWMYRYDGGDRGRTGPRQNHRGAAYWTDGNEERILFITPGYQLIALNAKNGQPVPSFGAGGVVDLYEGFDQPAPPNGQIGSSSPPMIVGDIAVIGAALTPVNKTKQNVAAFIRGYDVRTGRRQWIFHTIPRPGEFGNETWEADSWSYTGNTGVWTVMSADQELGYVYLPIETPTNDFYGGHRPGNNLFAESLVCLDARTGKRVWHYQLVHHGIWDYDTVAPPILLDVNVGGRRIKAVAQVTKQAFAYVFDRVTGAPVWPIVERPVPQSDVPGEKTSPTQPFPTKPAAFDRQGVSLDDLIDFTPELKAEARELASQYKLGPLFTPPIVAGAGGLRGVLMLPTATGGANWQGGAADPETGVLYVSSGTMISSSSLVHDPQRSEMEYIGGGGAPPPQARPRGEAGAPAAAGPRPPSMLGPQGLPFAKPPYGRITAIDLNSGDHLWMVPNGDTPDWIKNHPALKGVNLPRTGRYEHVGLLVTKTLLFAGEGSGLFAVAPGSGGPMFRALDKKSGETIFEFKLPANQSGIPMTYSVGGRQFIVVPAGAPGSPGEFIALTIDR